jgi:hypothetical protein
MNLIFYSREDDESSRQIVEHLRRNVQGENLVVCRTTSQISKALFQSTYDALAAVLSISDRADLHDVLSIVDILRSVKVILILPDAHGEIMSKAHVLRPRFLVQKDEDFARAVSVIDRMRTGKARDRKKVGDDTWESTFQNSTGMEKASGDKNTNF